MYIITISLEGIEVTRRPCDTAFSLNFVDFRAKIMEIELFCIQMHSYYISYE